MRWKDRRDNAQKWRPWFAWWPVKIDGTWVWLEWVERVAVADIGWDGMTDWIYTHRLRDS